MRKLGFFPRLLIILALLICQQLAVSHTISHVHQNIEQVSQSGSSSDEANCDTCHALGGLNHFFAGIYHDAFIEQGTYDVPLISFGIHFAPVTHIHFESRAPPAIA